MLKVKCSIVFNFWQLCSWKMQQILQNTEMVGAHLLFHLISYQTIVSAEESHAQIGRLLS